MRDKIENPMVVERHEPAQTPRFACDICGEPIYEGDTYYELENKDYCVGCVIYAKKEA